MNLPPEVCTADDNVFFVGMTPGPRAPSVIEISHVLAPLVDTLNEFWTGKILPTHRHRQGTQIRVRLLPVIADIEAIRKVSGFLGPSAHLFCSFCDCRLHNIESLETYSWRKRDGDEVKAHARQWKATVQKTKKADLATKNGVRWTPLHDLVYWDPVKHLVLGFMHNTLEGILETQLRDLWGIGRSIQEKTRIEVIDEEEFFYGTDAEIFEFDSDLEGLFAESQEYASSRESQTPDNDTPPVSELSDSDGTVQDNTHPIDIDDDMDSLYDLDYSDMATIFDFTAEQLEAIRDCIRSVELPTYVNRPPGNLGEASHGKLKANEMLILFTVIFPMILPELWYSNGHAKGDYEEHLLENFYHLVASTNIISSFSTSDSEADEYFIHYLQYRRTLPQLFSNFHSKPNHHYAMHNDELLKFWGPLASLSEFSGERLLGLFQRINTNRHMCEFLLL